MFSVAPIEADAPIYFLIATRTLAEALAFAAAVDAAPQTIRTDDDADAVAETVAPGAP